MALPQVTEVRRLGYRPGDRLVVWVPRGTLASAEMAAEIARGVRRAAALPPESPVVVLETGWEVMVFGPEYGT